MQPGPGQSRSRSALARSSTAPVHSFVLVRLQSFSSEQTTFDLPVLQEASADEVIGLREAAQIRLLATQRQDEFEQIALIDDVRPANVREPQDSRVYLGQHARDVAFATELDRF